MQATRSTSKTSWPSWLRRLLVAMMAALAGLPAAGGQWVEIPPKYSCPAGGGQELLYPCQCDGASDAGLQIRCHNTNIASMSVALRTVAASGAPVDTLRLTGCNVEKLFGPDIFRAPLKVRAMAVEDTPIRDMSDDTFEGSDLAGSLEELHLVNTGLTRMPPCLRNLTALKVLRVENSRVGFLPPGALDGLAGLAELTVGGAAVADLGPETFRGLGRLKKLSLFRNNVSTLVRGAFKHLKELEFLDLSHNSLDRLQPHFFADLTRLIWLNVSHNRVPEMTSRSFSRSGLLRVLHLEGNRIKSLDATSFRGMRFLRRLFLSDNLISSIGRGTFAAINRIGTLDLARNKLAAVPPELFADLRYVEVIDVAENGITELGRGAFKHIFLTQVNISHNLVRTVEDGVFEFCENMTVLDMSHNDLESISSGAFDPSSYATEWRLDHNFFTSTRQIPLESHKGLKVLNVSHNQIVEVAPNTFPKLYELYSVDLSHNNLTAVADGAFANLLSLRSLDLSHNHLAGLGAFTFGKITTLLDLDLSHNRLEDLGRGLFGGLVSVRRIDASSNLLRAIPDLPISLTSLDLASNRIGNITGSGSGGGSGLRSPWPVMNSLLELSLDHNLLDDDALSAGGKFDNLNTVSSLGLRGNLLTRPPREALGALRSLQKLRMDGNRIKALGKDAFGSFGVVAELGLSGNGLSNISYGAFENLLQLQTLDLSNNSLHHVAPGAFIGLKALARLDLSHNSLKRLQNRTHGLLEDCLSIKSVNLSHNDINFVTKKMFPEHQWIPYKLESVDLSGNRIAVVTDDIVVGTKHLKVLNLSRNAIHDIQPGTLANLSRLEVLDLSGNSLEDKAFDKDNNRSFGHFPELVDLSLNGNRLTRLPMLSELVRHQKLRHLDLRANRLREYSPEFTDLVKVQNLTVRYAGNPLQCDCRLRPLVYWLESSGRSLGRAGPWEEARCATPEFLAGQPVGSVSELKLICADSEHNTEEFQVNPDVTFRDVRPDKAGGLDVSWYVSTNEDVGNFKLELQTRTFPRSVIFSQDLSYGTRHQSIHGVRADEEVNLCLLARTSTGRYRNWKQEQCRIVGPLNSGSDLRASAMALALALAIVVLAKACLPAY